MPKNLTPQDQWETEFQVPLPGEPRNIGPLETLFQKLLNRTERLKGRIGAILGAPWDSNPPSTVVQLHDRTSTLETSTQQHRTAPVLDHPDGSVTTVKLADSAVTFSKLASDAISGILGLLWEAGENANGLYVRFQNGVQICMARRLLLSFYNANHMFVIWTFPAAFVAADYVPLALYDFASGDTGPYFVKSLQARNKSTTSVTIDLLSNGMFTSSDIRYVSLMAIGRWK